MAEVMKWTLISMCVIGVIAVAYSVGKPRGPITAGTFVWVLVWNVIEVISILAFWRTS